MGIIRPQNLRVGSHGTFVVAVTCTTTPFLRAWLFSQSGGWSTVFGNPTAPAYTTNGLSIAVGNENGSIVTVGNLRSFIYTFPFDEHDTSSGWGSAVQTAFTFPYTVQMTQDRSNLLVCGDGGLAEYAFASGAIGSNVYTLASTFGANFRICRLINDDKHIVLTFTSGSTFATFDRSTSPPTHKSTSGNFGVATGFSMSPNVLFDGTRAMAIPTNSTFQIWRINADGTIGSQLNPVFDSAVRQAIFDPYGRLITVQTSSPELQIHTLDSDTGVFTVLDTDTGWGAKGTPGRMAYDKERDVLFIGHSATPYITAWPMRESGFGTVYSAPGTVAPGAVKEVSLLYDSSWKNFNT